MGHDPVRNLSKSGLKPDQDDQDAWWSAKRAKVRRSYNICACIYEAFLGPPRISRRVLRAYERLEYAEILVKASESAESKPNQAKSSQSQAKAKPSPTEAQAEAEPVGPRRSQEVPGSPSFLIES